MLESRLSVQIVDDCLSHPDAAPAIVRSGKSTIIDADMGSLIISALHHPSACHIATIATKISWNHLWNLALVEALTALPNYSALSIICHDPPILVSSAPFVNYLWTPPGLHISAHPTMSHSTPCLCLLMLSLT